VYRLAYNGDVVALKWDKQRLTWATQISWLISFR